MPTEFQFKDRSSLLTALQHALVQQLHATLAHAQATTLFVSGGSTPIPLYRRLASETLPWDRIRLALVDERWVPLSDPASNEAMLRSTLLQDKAAGATLTGMKSAVDETEGSAVTPATATPAFVGADQPKMSTSLQAAEETCNKHYRTLPRPWSAALLGMGADGHTASLFPHAQGLQAAFASREPCAAIEAAASSVTGSCTARMTLTPWALLRCERLFLLFTGNDKRAVYEAALHSDDPLAMPVSHFLQQTQVPIDLYWCP